MERLFLPTKRGGFGLQSAARVATAAWYASWSEALVPVCRHLAAPDLPALRDVLPGLALALDAAARDLRGCGAAPPPLFTPETDEAARSARQRILVEACQTKAADAHVEGLDASNRAVVRSAGGPGGGAWLQHGCAGGEALANSEWQVAVRLRAGLSLCTPGACCMHRKPDGGACGARLDPLGAHAMACKSGGAVVRRHNLVRDLLARQVTECLHVPALTEQVVPAWARGTTEARLDVVYRQDSGVTAYLDCAVTSCHARDVAAVAAVRDGAAAARLEVAKHRRYPGQRLTPLVWEAHGRSGDSALAWQRSLVATLDPGQRAVCLAGLRRQVAVAVQRGNSALVLGALGAYAASLGIAD